MRPLRLGLLGTGIAARQLYWPALKGMGRTVQVVACANRTRSKAEAFAELARIPLVVDSAEALFKLPQLDAVLISLPIDQQPRYVLKALKAGKHVLSEKPIAPNLKAGQALLKAAAPYQRRGLQWLVGENYAFMPHALKALDWLAARALGDVRLAEVRQTNFLTPATPYYHTDWRRQPRFVGGFVLDAGVHLAHLLRRIFGMPVELKALQAQFNPALPPMDTALGLLRFRSGALGTWTSCFAMSGGSPMLTLRGSKADLMLHHQHGVLRSHRGGERVFKSPNIGFEGQFSHFAQAVLAGKPLAFTPREALADLALMQGIVQGERLKP